MIFVPKKNIWTPPRNWGMPKYQKGVLHPAGFWAAAGSSDVVTLSGEFVNVQPNWEDVAGIYVYGTGTYVGKIRKREGTTYTVIDGTTDWVIPNSSGSDTNYDIKCTITADVGGSSGFTINSGTGTWLQLGGFTRSWGVQADGPYGADSRDITFTLEISDDGGSTTLDSASYQVRSAGDV